jgi:hypothetical protein
MKRFLDQHKSEGFGVTVAPQENVRPEVLRCYLKEYLTLINKIVLIVPTELLFNLGETGLSEWENRGSKPVLVPILDQESSLHHPVDRSLRHHTLLYCVAASRDSYCLMLIAPTASARKLFDTGVRDDIDLIIEMRQPVYTTAELFHRYIAEVFFPTLETNRHLPNCEHKPCTLFYYNCSIHRQDQLFKEFAERGVAVTTSPPHTSHIFQVLDLLLFGRLKAAKKYIPRADTDPTNTIILSEFSRNMHWLRSARQQ